MPHGAHTSYYSLLGHLAPIPTLLYIVQSVAHTNPPLYCAIWRPYKPSIILCNLAPIQTLLYIVQSGGHTNPPLYCAIWRPYNPQETPRYNSLLCHLASMQTMTYNGVLYIHPKLYWRIVTYIQINSFNGVSCNLAPIQISGIIVYYATWRPYKSQVWLCIMPPDAHTNSWYNSVLCHLVLIQATSSKGVLCHLAPIQTPGIIVHCATWRP